MNHGYLTPRQVAAYLAVTPRTVRNLISDGKLLAVQVGRAWRVRKDWLEDYERRLVAGARSRAKRVFDPMVDQALPGKPDLVGRKLTAPAKHSAPSIRRRRARPAPVTGPAIFPPETLHAARAKAGARATILASTECSCYGCLALFEPADIVEWIADGQTALCPRCLCNCVLGDASGYPVTKPEMARAMHTLWRR